MNTIQLPGQIVLINQVIMSKNLFKVKIKQKPSWNTDIMAHTCAIKAFVNFTKVLYRVRINFKNVSVSQTKIIALVDTDLLIKTFFLYNYL